MDAIALEEQRNQMSEVLRRVEAGERLTVTVAGRPVSEPSRTDGRRWVGGEPLARVLQGPTPRGLADDIAQLPAGPADPFDR